MPYIIVTRTEPKTDPLVVARVCLARIEESCDGLLVHVLEKAPFEAMVVRAPKWTSTAWTYQLMPVAERSLNGVPIGPYSDISSIKAAVEDYTSDTCAIRVSA